MWGQKQSATLWLENWRKGRQARAGELQLWKLERAQDRCSSRASGGSKALQPLSVAQ